MEHLETSKDEDAKTGHKTADTSFFGYKTHIAMTEERIITAATITSGEKIDGKELPKLVQKSKAAGIRVGGCNRVLKIPFDSCIQGISKGRNQRKKG